MLSPLTDRAFSLSEAIARSGIEWQRFDWFNDDRPIKMTPLAPDFDLTCHPDDRRQRLEAWRKNCGAPVALNMTGPPSENADDSRALVVLNWNVWIGHGRLRQLIWRIRNGDFADHGATPDAGLVVLAQEVYRSDAAIPLVGSKHAASRPATRAGHQREEIVDTALALGMNLRYAPSMRNGSLQSDRGNAILSTMPLEDAYAIELPFTVQRRVVVAATVRVAGASVSVVSAHLDPRGPPGHRWLGANARAFQARYLVESLRTDTVVLGADLNLTRGKSEPAWRILQDAGFRQEIASASPNWRHTYHAMPRLVLDHVLVRDPTGIIARADVHRLDEHPLDRGSLVFGSDHHPLLARIEVATASAATA